jgi:hypothetical protein
MKRVTTILAAAAAVVVCASTFAKASAAVGTGGLSAYWTETDLRTDAKQAYKLTADVEATYGCFNKAGKNPPSGNKQVTFTQDMVADVIKVSDKEGTVTGSMTLGMPAVGSRLSCPTGQKAMIGTVTYRNVVLMNATAGSSYPFPKSYAKTFRAIGK